MLRAIALDADPSALEILDTFCQQTDTVVISRKLTQPSEARQYLRHNPVDLVFMDIDLPTESGKSRFRWVVIMTMNSTHSCNITSLRPSFWPLRHIDNRTCNRLL